MRKAVCDGRKIEGLMEGFSAGLMEVVVAFKLCLKHREGIMASDYGMERESTPRVEGTPGLKTESAGKHGTCGLVAVICIQGFSSIYLHTGSQSLGRGILDTLQLATAILPTCLQ